MFRLRRKKGQGAIEYLFMIAAALVIILIAVRYVGQSTGNASQQADIASLQSQAELIKSRLLANQIWDDGYTIDLTSATSTSGSIAIKDSDGNTVATATSDKYNDWNGYTPSPSTLGQTYKDCMNGEKKACYLIIDLEDAQKS